MSCLLRVHMPLTEEERARRISEIADLPDAGNRKLALHLLKSLMQAKLTLQKLSKQLDD
jgi:hypothetical protein